MNAPFGGRFPKDAPPVETGAKPLVRPANRRFSVKSKITLVATLFFVLSLLLISALQLFFVKAEMQTERRIIEAALFLSLLVAPLVWLTVRRLYDPLEAALREREAGLQRAQSMARLAHVVTAPDGGFESWSETLPQLIGISLEQMPKNAREWLSLLHPDDREQFRARSRQAGISRQHTNHQYRLQRPDGTSIEILHEMEPLDQADAEGKSRWFNTLQDVTGQERAEATLRESERRFSDMLANVQLVSLMLDRAARITYCNDFLLRLTGREREEVVGLNWFDLFIPPDAKVTSEVFEDLLADLPNAWHHENEILTKSGDMRLIRWNNSVLRSALGDVVGTASIGEDITEQKQAEIKIRGLNRVYAMLSGINSLIVRVHDRDELFRESCRIAVEHGQFKTALIGIVDSGAKNISLAAMAGVEPEFLAPFHDGFPLHEDSPLRNTAVARVVREKQPIVSNDVQSDPGASFPKECVELRTFSTAVLPLIVSGEVVGVFALLADNPGYFDDAEMKLLMELAGDIAYALDHIQKAERLNYLAYYDAVTGLANRTLFLERLEEKLLAARAMQSRLSVSVLDIERLQSINDAFGRRAGDQLLLQVADRLTHLRGDATRLARIGFEAFAVVSADVQNEAEVGRMTGHKLQSCFGPPFHIGAQELRVPARAGIAMYPTDGETAEAMLRCAESALKRAKDQGERYLFFEPKMTERIAERLSLENELRHAVEKQEFVLYYQPKVDLEKRAIVGVEALIRWQSPARGLVPPIQFIQLLEESGLILQVGAWALRRAALDHRRWTEQTVNAPRVAVNVSAIQLRQKDFVDVVEESISSGLTPPGIDLEVTESLVIEDIAGSVEKLRALRALGMGIALDDFGTGYSSLAYLAKLPIEALKIDRSFIILMLKNPDTMTLVKTIISMAHSLHLKVIAEGVETEEQAGMLLELRCDQMQGYLFSKPVPFEAMTALLKQVGSEAGRVTALPSLRQQV
jgi:diguanylate cyclase (GGDEF)-like protein/PAS domain S-box-containing protein